MSARASTRAAPRINTPVLALAFTLGLLILERGAAFACPDCPPAVTARQIVFGEGFVRNLAAVSLPLVILCVITALLWRVGRREELS
jgi:hypothetical protein